jgi:hypothetical protein
MICVGSRFLNYVFIFSYLHLHLHSTLPFHVDIRRQKALQRKTIDIKYTVITYCDLTIFSLYLTDITQLRQSIYVEIWKISLHLESFFLIVSQKLLNRSANFRYSLRGPRVPTGPSNSGKRCQIYPFALTCGPTPKSLQYLI